MTPVAFAQEESDDFFEEDEPPMESDFDYQPPPVTPGGSPEETNRGAPVPPRENRFGRPSFNSTNNNNNNSSNYGGGSSSFSAPSDGSFEFRLVDPPEYKKKKSRLNVPNSVRGKVDAKLKAVEQLKAGGDK